MPFSPVQHRLRQEREQLLARRPASKPSEPAGPPKQAEAKAPQPVAGRRESPWKDFMERPARDAPPKGQQTGFGGRRD